MPLKDQLDALLDATAFDSTGTKIGAVRQVYVDDASGKVTFATVATGIFSSDAIVPLHGARLLDGELHVDHTRTVVRDSPRADHTEDGLTPDQESRLLEYYGIELPARGADAAPATPPPPPAKATTTPPPGTAEQKTTPRAAEQKTTPSGAKPDARTPTVDTGAATTSAEGGPASGSASESSAEPPSDRP